MRLRGSNFLVFLAGFSPLGLVWCGVAEETDGTATLREIQKQAMDALGREWEKKVAGPGGCTLSTAAVRSDWQDMSKEQRGAYIQAVKCLQDRPSKAPEYARAARTRFDDFVAVHANLADQVHVTGNFLTYHRYTVWAFEKALRDECGYGGYQPYWNWFGDAADIHKSVLFDGSDTSFGGDGAHQAHQAMIGGNGRIVVPPGRGGGCVETGPFANLSLHVGPINPAMDGMAPLVRTINDYNPRCMRRDLNSRLARHYFNASLLVNLTMGAASATLAEFQAELQGRPDDGFLGMHAAGHWAIGGDMSDFYCAPNDPIFYMHHATVDLVFSLWQALHPSEAREVSGTITPGNDPPSRPAVLDDWLDMGVNAPRRTIRDLQGTLDATPLCYVYG